MAWRDIHSIKRFFNKTVLISVSLCCVLLLSACQEQAWYTESDTVDDYQVTAEFPSKPSIMTRTYQLLADEVAAPLNMVQWFATDSENSFNVSYIVVPNHLDTGVVVKELLRSMTLKRDPRLGVAPAEFVAEYEQDLPAIGEPFDVGVSLESRHLSATAMVVQEGNLVVQLYAAGVGSNKNFNDQRQRFFEQFKIGATIP